MSLNTEFFEFEKEEQRGEELINGELLILHSKKLENIELNENNISSHVSHGSGHTSHVSHGHTSAAG